MELPNGLSLCNAHELITFLGKGSEMMVAGLSGCCRLVVPVETFKFQGDEEMGMKGRNLVGC